MVRVGHEWLTFSFFAKATPSANNAADGSNHTALRSSISTRMLRLAGCRVWLAQANQLRGTGRPDSHSSRKLANWASIG